MPRKTEASLDPYSTTAQWSRRFIGLKLFLALAERGECGYAEMIEHQARMGEVLRKSLRCAGWRIVNKTPLPVVCFTRDGLVPGTIPARASRTPDRLDVGGPAGRERSRLARMRHQLSDYGAGHRLRGSPDESNTVRTNSAR